MSDPLRDRLDSLECAAASNAAVELGDALRAVLDVGCRPPHCYGPGYHSALADVRRAIANALDAAGTEPVYPGGGLASTELQPTASCNYCAPHEFVPFNEAWDEPDSECEWCGKEQRDAVHHQRGEPWPVAGVADFLARDRQQRAGDTT